jgi:hypothetical protein
MPLRGLLLCSYNLIDLRSINDTDISQYPVIEFPQGGNSSVHLSLMPPIGP